MSFYKIMLFTGYIILAINAFIYFKSYRGKTVAFKVFAFYLLFTLVIQLTSRYMNANKIENLHLSHYYFIGQFILFSFFFYKTVINKKIFSKVIPLVLIIVLVILTIYYSINPEKYFEFNEFEILITSLPLLLYSFLFFLEKIEDHNKKFIYIVSGFFIYILSSTLLFTIGNIPSGIKPLIWKFNAFLYIVFQVLIFIEWYKHFRKKKESTEIAT